MSNVASYADERALRGVADLPDLDDELAGVASDEMAEALARVDAPARPEPPAPTLSAIERQWERFRPMLEEAMAGGLYTVDDLAAEVGRGEAYFWPGRNAVLVAKPISYPSGETVMQVQWAAGDLAEVLTLLPGVEATGRLLGCSSMLVEGRKAWERVLREHGYGFWSVTVGKAL
jgi:hypothetical protein